MKPSRYTFLIVPDHDGESRRFSLSRNGTLFIIIFTIFMILGVSISYAYLIPLSINYSKMETRYNDVIGERVEVLELYRDLERMKQMEIVVQKALGMDLGESDSSETRLTEMMNDYPIKLSYLNNVPSLLPIDGVMTQDMVVSSEDAMREHYGVDIVLKEKTPVKSVADGIVIFSEQSSYESLLKCITSPIFMFTSPLWPLMPSEMLFKSSLESLIYSLFKSVK